MDQAQAQEKIVRVIIESPYAGDVDSNVSYLQSCLRDSLLRGEAPYASHGLYTQPGVLRDDDPGERKHGIEAGFAWRRAAHLTAFYVDRGFSSGMNQALQVCLDMGHAFEFRSIRTGATYLPCVIAYQEREHSESSSITQRTKAS